MTYKDVHRLDCGQWGSNPEHFRGSGTVTPPSPPLTPLVSLQNLPWGLRPSARTPWAGSSPGWTPTLTSSWTNRRPGACTWTATSRAPRRSLGPATYAATSSSAALSGAPASRDTQVSGRCLHAHTNERIGSFV